MCVVYYRVVMSHANYYNHETAPSPPASLMSSHRPLYTIPINQRPRISWLRSFKALLFVILFDAACLMINGSQFVFLLPFRILPIRWARKLYYAGIRYTKGSFGCLQSLSSPCPSIQMFIILFPQFSCASGLHPQSLWSHSKPKEWVASLQRKSTSASSRTVTGTPWH